MYCQLAEHERIRKKFFHNRMFKSLDGLEDHLLAALKTLEDNTSMVGSIAWWPWIMSALLLTSFV